ncbi:MAG: hypothetical protein ACI4LA_06225 [Emergencia sp.]
MEREQKLKEIREAIDAGMLTRRYLEQARTELDSASGFGLADMLGFDLIGGIGKHMKLGNARQQMELARQQVAVFQKELQDVNCALNLNLELGGFLTFADFFLDGILADILVQSKIGEMKQQVENGLYQLSGILERLSSMEMEILKEK